MFVLITMRIYMQLPGPTRCSLIAPLRDKIARRKMQREKKRFTIRRINSVNLNAFSRWPLITSFASEWSLLRDVNTRLFISVQPGFGCVSMDAVVRVGVKIFRNKLPGLLSHSLLI